MMTWKQAFRKQARSDYDIFSEFNNATNLKPICHQLHYLQMATEKLAKSFFCDQTLEPPRKTHYGFVRLLRMLKTRPDII